MSTIPGCQHCDRPVPDGAELCTACTTALAEALRGVPDLVEQLWVTYSKQDRLGVGGGHRGRLSESPLPVRFEITRVIDSLSNTMTTWARVLVDYHGWDVPNPPRRRPHNTGKPDPGGDVLGRGDSGRGRGLPVFPASSPTVDLACYAAQWLAEHVGHLRQCPAALEAHQQLTDAIAAAQAAIDRSPVLAFRGPCRKCGRDLSATPQAAIVVCGACGEQHDGPTLRDRLLDKAADQLVTTVELSAVLSGLSGMSVPMGTIRSWRSRGQLAPHAWLHEDRAVVARPIEPRDKPLFRVGDAVQLLAKLRASRPGLQSR